MSEIIEAIAGLLWIALGVKFARMMRRYKEEFEKVLEELEEELHG